MVSLPEFAQLTEHHLVPALDASMAKPIHNVADLLLLLL